MNGGANAVHSIHYHLSWPDPHSHYFHVRMTIRRERVGSVFVSMPAWRPGRYIIQNYARYIIGFEAKTSDEAVLHSFKTDKDTWHIEAGYHDEIVVHYKAYAHVLDAGESYVDETEAYLNPISVLMYIHGAEFTPSSISFDKPAHWNVATALPFDDASQGYHASDYHELVDSPFIISPDFNLLSFELGGAKYEIVFQGHGNYDPDTVIDEVKRIATVQADIMQVVPFERYVFLYHLLPVRFGHGVEHKNSTSIVIGPADFEEQQFRERYLGLTSHELFHVWNVERIRPEALYYPDYSKEVYTTTMWVYEGITSYYTDLVLVRAGLVTPEDYFVKIASTLQRYDEAPGRKVTSVAMTSWNSWINTAAPPGTTYSFYTAGHVLGLLLDLEIRGRTANQTTLDDVFRYLYTEYAEQDRGVPEDGFKRALETVTESCFQEFYDAYVFGVEEIDYNTYLRHAGLDLEKVQQQGDGAQYTICTLNEPTELQQQIRGSWLKRLA